MPVQNSVYLAVADTVTHFFFVCFCYFTNIQHMSLLCLMPILLQKCDFLIFAHISPVPPVMLLRYRSQPFRKIFSDQVAHMGAMEVRFTCDFI